MAKCSFFHNNLTYLHCMFILFLSRTLPRHLVSRISLTFSSRPMAGLASSTTGLANEMLKMALQPTAESPGLATPMPSTFLTVSTEIRLKIYENVLSKITVTCTLRKPSTSSWNNSKGPVCAPDSDFISCKPEPSRPLALLGVSKNIRHEAMAVVVNCPISLTVYGCHGRNPWEFVRIPNTLRHQICSIITDEPLWDWSNGTIKCCLNKDLYANLRYVEIQGSDLKLTLPFEVCDSLLMQTPQYKLDPSITLSFYIVFQAGQHSCQRWWDWAKSASNYASRCCIVQGIGYLLYITTGTCLKGWGLVTHTHVLLLLTFV